MKILILASNPRKDLNLDDEIRLLRSVIDRSPDRDQFEIVSEPGVRVGDLQGLLLRHKPQIVHFCGHGGGEEGLIFKMDGGGEQSVRADALANIFGLNLICSHVKCVLLNACYSEKQADAIVSRIDYVVGMSHAIQDNAAIAFSKGFYLALGGGCSIDDAFEFGRNAIQLEISGSSKTRSAAMEQRKAEVVDAVTTTVIPEHLKPILKRNSTLTEASNRQVSGSEPTLFQAKREKIQLNVAKVLTEEKPGLKQFREQVREYLQNHQLADYEKDLLDELRGELGLSTEEANGVLEEEQAPIRQAQQAYEKRLVALIKYYPFSDVIQRELKKFQMQRKLTDEEVNEISEPFLAQAEVEYQKANRDSTDLPSSMQAHNSKIEEAVEVGVRKANFVSSTLETRSQAIKQGRFIVVTIGINKYKHWMGLNNAVKDATGFQETLVKRLGFNQVIEPLLNEKATKQAIELLICDDLPKLLKEDDNLILFFAGHGHTCIHKSGDEILAEVGYLVPVEARYPEYWSDFIEMGPFLENVGRLPAKHILVILDACHSGFALGNVIKTFRGAPKRYHQDMIKRRSRKVITSAMHDQSAVDSGPIVGHSLFTGTLIKGIEKNEVDDSNEGYLTSTSLGYFIKQKVGSASESNQTPAFGTFNYDNQGEMVIWTLSDENVSRIEPSLIASKKAEDQRQLDLDVTLELVLTAEEMTNGAEKFVFTGQENITVKIPAGINSGKRIRVKGKGTFNSFTQNRGDLYLVVKPLDTPSVGDKLGSASNNSGISD